MFIDELKKLKEARHAKAELTCSRHDAWEKSDLRELAFICVVERLYDAALFGHGTLQLNTYRLADYLNVMSLKKIGTICGEISFGIPMTKLRLDDEEVAMLHEILYDVAVRIKAEGLTVVPKDLESIKNFKPGQSIQICIV